MPMPMSMCVYVCVCVCVRGCVGAHTTIHTPDVLVSMCVCVCVSWNPPTRTLVSCTYQKNLNVFVLVLF